MTRSGAEPAPGERGSGLLPSLAGTVVFLVLLLVAVQVLFNLYATSAVSAAAFDAARVVAGADAGERQAATAAATVAARASLGRYGQRAHFGWSITPEVIELHVTAENPSFLPVGVRRPLGLDVIDRRVRVRAEDLQ